MLTVAYEQMWTDVVSTSIVSTWASSIVTGLVGSVCLVMYFESLLNIYVMYNVCIHAYVNIIGLLTIVNVML